jgi:single-stranded-DNA-specific exonuclease
MTQRLVANKHLKMTLSLIATNQQIDAIAFNVNLSHWPNYRVEQIMATYRLGVNYYQGRKKLQLIIESFAAE